MHLVPKRTRHTSLQPACLHASKTFLLSSTELFGDVCTTNASSSAPETNVIMSRSSGGHWKICLSFKAKKQHLVIMLCKMCPNSGKHVYSTLLLTKSGAIRQCEHVVKVVFFNVFPLILHCTSITLWDRRYRLFHSTYSSSSSNAGTYSQTWRDLIGFFNHSQTEV